MERLEQRRAEAELIGPRVDGASLELLGRDATDPQQRAAVTDEPAKKDDFTRNGAEIAKMMKGTVVASCPTDSVVGTCNVGFGMLVNYSGPKWTKETAQKHCVAQPHATWIE